MCSKCSFSKNELDKIEMALKREGIDIKIKDISLKNGILTIPKLETFNYTVKQEIKKTIAETIKTFDGGQ